MVWTGDSAARPFSAVYRSLLDRSNALSHLTPGTMAPASTANRHRLCVSPVEEIWRSPLESGDYLHHWNGLSMARLSSTCAALWMANLGCQQMSESSSLALKSKLILGMWWVAPPSPAWRIRQTHISANTPFMLDEVATAYGYPGGHAIRWMFLGLILSWLVWTHVRKRLLRRLLLVITLAIAFGGGLLLVYTGSHLVTDLLAGYLIGASAACCAIGLLMQNEARREKERPKVTDVLDT